jgi:hypothetical protein
MGSSPIGSHLPRNHSLGEIGQVNTAQLFTLFALANLMIAKRRLFELQAQGAS